MRSILSILLAASVAFAGNQSNEVVQPSLKQSDEGQATTEDVTTTETTEDVTTTETTQAASESKKSESKKSESKKRSKAKTGLIIVGVVTVVVVVGLAIMVKGYASHYDSFGS